MPLELLLLLSSILFTDLNEHEHNESDDEEVDDRHDKAAICEDRSASFFSFGDRAVLAVAQHSIHAREINAAHKERMIGLIRSATNDPTIAVNAAPMMIPTAMSMTLPLAMKSLNSLSIWCPLLGLNTL